MPRNRDNLGKQAGYQDPYYLDNSRDPFKPQPWDKIMNVYRDLKAVDFTNSLGTYGTVTKFEVVRQADELSHCLLYLTRSALTVTGGTYARFVDFEGYHMIDHIDIYYETNDLKTITGDQLKTVFYNLDYDYEQRKREAIRVNGGLTTGQRNAKAAASSVIVLDLPVDWINWVNENTHKYFKFCAMPQPLKFDVYLKNLSTLVNTDGTAPVCSITAMQIKCDWFFKPDTPRMTDSNIVNSPVNNPMFGMPGYNFKIVRLEGGSQFFAAGLSTLSVDLRNIRNPGFALIAVIRNVDDIAGTNLASTNYNSLQPWTSYQIKDNGEDITHAYTLQDQQQYLTPRFWPRSLLGTNIIGFPTSMSPKGNIDNSNGEFNLARCNNPTMSIILPSAVTGNGVQVDWWFQTHNIACQTQGNLFVRWK
jgi:hypothetical protein